VGSYPVDDGVRERPNLTPDVIISAARKMIRTSGLQGLSIRKLAATLDVSPMAIYGHVESKEDLVSKIADSILAQLRPSAPPIDDHREHVVAMMSSFYDLMVDYPDLAHMLSVRRVSSPGLLRFIDELLVCLRGMGLNDDATMSAYNALMSFTFGSAVLTASRQGRRPASDQAALRRVEEISRGGDLRLVKEFESQLLLIGGRAHFRGAIDLILGGLSEHKRPPV
jgi:AcrR family transcriptional regulator